MGGTPSSMRWAMRWVSTRVLPEPAPATTSSGPPRCTTASSWSGFSECQIQRIEIELEPAVVAHGASILRTGCDAACPDVSVALRGACHESGSGCSPPSVAPSPGSSPSPSCAARLGHPHPHRPRLAGVAAARSPVWPSGGAITTGAAGRRVAPRRSSSRSHTFTHGVPARMAPLIFGGSVVGHLFGASVGREGAALQMAGLGHRHRVARSPAAPDERRTLIAASLAGGWGAVFAVPITGVLFTLQVTKHHRWRGARPGGHRRVHRQVVVDALGYTRATGRTSRPPTGPSACRSSSPSPASAWGSSAGSSSPLKTVSFAWHVVALAARTCGHRRRGHAWP